MEAFTCSCSGLRCQYHCPALAWQGKQRAGPHCYSVLITIPA